MVRALLEMLFPPRCASCGSGPWPFCSTCKAQIVALDEPMCATCGRPWEEAVTRCRDCPPPPLRSARAPFLYQGPVRAALHRLKFSGWRTMARALGASMVAVNAFPPDAVTWVPLSRRRRARRGYDQARALAVAVAEDLGLQAIPLLARARETPPQARSPAPERRRAMRGAFRATGRAPPGRVLLVDDVLTTGATAAECSRVLLSSGAREVGLLTAARALSGPLPARCYTPGDSRLGLWLSGEVPR